MITMDITRSGFRDSTFDLILCSHVLEHIPEDLAAMRELYRVLKEGGTCIVQVPMQVGLIETVDYAEPNLDEFDHVRAYGRDFLGRLQAIGFDLKRAEHELFEVTKPQAVFTYETANQ
jgi:SAM-dependent methyltransferase